STFRFSRGGLADGYQRCIAVAVGIDFQCMPDDVINAFTQKIIVVRVPPYLPDPCFAEAFLLQLSQCFLLYFTDPGIFVGRRVQAATQSGLSAVVEIAHLLSAP